MGKSKTEHGKMKTIIIHTQMTLVTLPATIATEISIQHILMI
jgi:hypothetical protein